MENLNKGFSPKTADEQVQTIEFPKNARDFFEKFVKTRTPVVINTGTEKTERVLDQKDWTLENLARLGNVRVHVESRQLGEFGTGNQRLELPFDELIARFKSGDDSLYLTTQYDEHEVVKSHSSDKSEPRKTGSVAQPPLDQLTDLFPAKPSFLDTLETQQINLWMGCTTRPTSSGLHHDFADNLYILLKGTKKFTLYSPKDAERMYTVGKIDTVHTNGLICYKENIRPDGARLADVLQWKLSKLEQSIQELSSKPDKSEEDDELLAELEEQLEEEMESALDLGAGSHFDEFDESVLESSQSGQSDSEDEQRARKRTKPASQQPPSFSSIPVSQLNDYAKYPKLKKAVKMEVTLNAGEMLYLPASWFHEVCSIGAESDAIPGLHVAVNYWMHPPGTLDYEKPYVDDYWASFQHC